MKNLIIAVTFTAAVSVLVSCKKELNALPAQAKVEGNAIVDQKSAQVALNGVYLRFAEGGDDRGTPSILWARSHEAPPSVLAGNHRQSNGVTPFEENSQITASDYSAGNIWSNAYSLVNAANGVIDQINVLPESKFSGSRRAEILAEARLLRAYGHYNLLRYFAQFYDLNSSLGVMLRLEFVSTNNIAKKRNTVKESYDAILSDLDDAIAHAPISSVNYYGNQWVAKAFKARVLMLRGSAGDYAQVVSLTQDIIQHSPYVLEGNLRDIFSTKGLGSKEVMLGLVPKPGQVSKSDTYFFRNSAQFLATAYFKSLMTGDPRGSWVIGTVGTSLDGIAKYMGPKVEESYALRLTEVYLLQAEGIIRSGGSLSDARALLKNIMAHAGVTNFTAVDNATTPDQLLLEVHKETVRNLSFEDGQDWTSLLRLPLATVLQIKPAITDKNHFILPIPAVEFEKNPTIGEQNPGYNKN
ncbi:RagB/SusD family nutrient uptake outer membrane protein [Pedobacter nyackensis]|uniref:SusD family protein n=1 Tax=Pedobacter nyackensis TaxID=475255 RepID=A0A1W2F5K7_9SPHI|nr:RagB/SusD family nutrient uptake outer membrane protein [Pedobacter nyackensis]SMD17213.1 SusD family protein [Pedobacter nyackensis]